MKESWLWDEDDLLELIKLATKESIDLEFKQCDSLQNNDPKKNEISKDVSAFANSAGGTIVYGMMENGHIATALDQGFNPNIISKEWLEQVINSRIQRKIEGIRINQISINKTHSGKVAYVVYIPASIRAPHQAFDKKFYKRYNFMSEPMEEYEVRDVSRRLETPDLRVDLIVGNQKLAFQKDNGFSEPFDIVGLITNDAIEPVNYAIMKISIDGRLHINHYSGLQMIPGGLLQIGNKRIPMTIFTMNWSIPSKMPIFHDVNFNLLDSPIKVAVPKIDRKKSRTYVLACEVQAPKMGMRRVFKLLTLSKGQIGMQPDTITAEELHNNPKIPWVDIKI